MGRSSEIREGSWSWRREPPSKPAGRQPREPTLLSAYTLISLSTLHWQRKGREPPRIQTTMEKNGEWMNRGKEIICSQQPPRIYCCQTKQLELFLLLLKGWWFLDSLLSKPMPCGRFWIACPKAHCQRHPLTSTVAREWIWISATLNTTLVSKQKARVGWFERIGWNMYITLCKVDGQCKFYVWSRTPKAGLLGQPRGIGWGGRWEGGSGWGIHMYPCGWFMLMYGKKHHNIAKSFSSN